MIHSALAQVITSLPSVSPSPKSPAAFVAYIFIFDLALTGLAVLIAFLVGALRYFAAAGNPSAVSDAKSRMQHALLGLAVVVFSVITLFTINPGLLQLKNPGINVDLSVPKTGGSPPSCTLTLAQWAGDGLPGSTVGMVVVGANCLDGTSAVFTVQGASGGVQTNISAVFQAGQADATWTVPVGSDGKDFYFDAVSGSEQIRSDALHVGGGAAVPLGQECTNTAASGQAPATCDAPCTNTVNPSTINPATGVPYADTCENYIRASAGVYQVSSALMVAIMQQECPSGNPYCTSPTGGCGLMGVNPTLLFDPNSPLKACQILLGPGASDPTQACGIMQANSSIAIGIAACILQIDTRTAARLKSENNYPPAQIQYTAAAWQAGVAANEPSCNCRNSGDATLPAGCSSQSATICQNCFTSIPKWLCPLDSPSPGVCAQNASYAPTRAYAATTDTLYAHYASCAIWQ